MNDHHAYDDVSMCVAMDSFFISRFIRGGSLCSSSKLITAVKICQIYIFIVTSFVNLFLCFLHLYLFFIVGQYLDRKPNGREGSGIRKVLKNAPSPVRAEFRCRVG